MSRRDGEEFDLLIPTSLCLAIFNFLLLSISQFYPLIHGPIDGVRSLHQAFDQLCLRPSRAFDYFSRARYAISVC